VDQGRKRRRKNRSRSRSKDRTKDQKKSRRKRSLTPEPQLGRAVEETEEEYDARLEREEKERIAARKLRDLEALRNRHEDGPVTEGTVRFKGPTYILSSARSLLTHFIGRGRMRYVDPEMRNEGRGD
jgi:peptidyl-prolyl isomerase G (cyclophilin G)